MAHCFSSASSAHALARYSDAITCHQLVLIIIYAVEDDTKNKISLYNKKFLAKIIMIDRFSVFFFFTGASTTRKKQT